MKGYDQLQPGVVDSLKQLMDWHGLQNAWMQQSNKSIGQIGNRMNSNTLANARAGGFGGGNLPAFLQASLARNQRATGGMQGNAFLQTLFQAKNMQLQGTSLAQQYRPLQTGQNTTESTSGLGTWLPQLAGAGLGAAMSFIPGMGATSGLNSIIKGTKSLPASGWAGSGGSYPSQFQNWGAPTSFGG